MSADQRVFTRSGLDAAVSAARQDERRRVLAILTCAEASGREQLAIQLATGTAMTVDQARAQLRGEASAPASPTPPPTTHKAAATATDASALWDQSLRSRGMQIEG